MEEKGPEVARIGGWFGGALCFPRSRVTAELVIDLFEGKKLVRGLWIAVTDTGPTGPQPSRQRPDISGRYLHSVAAKSDLEI